MSICRRDSTVRPVTPDIIIKSHTEEDKYYLCVANSGSCETTSIGTLTPRFNDKPTRIPEIKRMYSTLPQSKSVTLTTVATIVGGWILAFVLSIVHHEYLSHIHGTVVKNIPNGAFGSQLWIKSASLILVRGVALSLGLMAGSVLTQMLWRVPATSSMPLSKLDTLFKLPSALAMPPLIFSSFLPVFLPTLILGSCIQALELVTVFAPNSLQVIAGPAYVHQMNVNSLDLSQPPLMSIIGLDRKYVQPSAELSRTIQTSIMSPSSISLPPPINCILGCSYTVTYDAPALQCRNLSDSELLLPTYEIGGDNGSSENVISLLYNGTSLRGSGQKPYQIRIEWSELAFTGRMEDYNPTPSPRSGVECLWHLASYQASVSFQGTVQSIQLTTLSIISPLIPEICDQMLLRPFSPCTIQSLNYQGIIGEVSSLLYGQIIFDWDSERIVSTVGKPELVPLFNIATDSRLATTGAVWSFQPTSEDVGKSIEEMVANVTLGLMAARNDGIIGEVTFDGGPPIWSYEPRLLWATYGTALGVFGLFALYGLWCIADGGVADSTISNIIVATRGKEIDRACVDSESRETLQKVRLRYGKRGKFEVVVTTG